MAAILNIRFHFCADTDPQLAAILGVFPLDQIADVGAPMSENPRLISREIRPIFKVFRPVGQRTGTSQKDDSAWHGVTTLCKAWRGKNKRP